MAWTDYGVPDGRLPDVDDRAKWVEHNPALGIRLAEAEVSASETADVAGDVRS
jgi:hypothetical protein